MGTIIHAAKAHQPKGLSFLMAKPYDKARYKTNELAMPLTKPKIQKIFERFQAQEQHPTTELKFKSNFELLISVMLSAQATDVSVNKATANLYKVANTPKKMVLLGENGLKKYLKTINFFNTKVKHILRTCELLIEKHKGQVPDSREALEALPGVGRKTANVVLNTAFGHDTIAVDTHIFRVCNRTGLAPGKDVVDVEKNLLTVVPKQFKKDAHHWLILHGRYTCTARKPKCTDCLIANLCAYEKKED